MCQQRWRVNSIIMDEKAVLGEGDFVQDRYCYKGERVMFSFDSKVRYSEVGKDGYMTMEALMRYFQDCATFHSEETGYGVEYLMENKRAWVLLSWQIEVERYPRFGENITLSTKVYDFKRSFGYRNLMLQDESGAYIACANSVWLYLNLEKMAPERVEQEQVDANIFEEKFPMNYKKMQIAIPKEEGEVKETHQVGSYQIDTNGHMNNVEYLRMAMQAIGEQVPICSMRAEYKKSAMNGDQITPVVYREDTRYIVALNQDNGKPFAVIEIDSSPCSIQAEADA